MSTAPVRYAVYSHRTGKPGGEAQKFFCKTRRQYSPCTTVYARMLTTQYCWKISVPHTLVFWFGDYIETGCYNAGNFSQDKELEAAASGAVSVANVSRAAHQRLRKV